MLIFPTPFSYLPLPSSIFFSVPSSLSISFHLFLSLSFIHTQTHFIYIYIYPSSFLISFYYIFSSTHILAVVHHRSSTNTQTYIYIYIVLAMGLASLLVSHIIPIDFVENWRCKEIVKDWFRLRLVRVWCVCRRCTSMYIMYTPTTTYRLRPGEWWPTINWLHKKKKLP